MEARVATLERRLTMAQDSAPRAAAGAFVTMETSAAAGSIGRSPSREEDARAGQNRPWLQQASVTQQAATSQRPSAAAESESGSGGNQRRQQQQQQQQQPEKGQQREQQQGQQRAGGGSGAHECRTLGASKAAELELFRREVNVKREARHRALAAVSAELERLRRELQHERRVRRSLEVRLGQHGNAMDADAEEQSQVEEDPEDEELSEADGERHCQVSLEEDMHLKLEQTKNELETERELRRALEDSVEQLRRQLEVEECRRSEAEELRADLDAERSRRAEVESEVEKLRTGEDRESVAVAECLRGQLDGERGARRRLERQLQAMVEGQLKRDRKEASAICRLEQCLEKEKSARLELERQLAAVSQQANQDKEAEISRLKDQLEKEKNVQTEMERQSAAGSWGTDRDEAVEISGLEERPEEEKSVRFESERQSTAVSRESERHDAADISRLREQLEKERGARVQLQRQLAVARREEAALLGDLARLRDELDSERDRRCHASAEAEAERGRAKASEEEKRRLEDQVAALKDVAAVGRQLLQLREEQVERLEARLRASEAVAAATPEGGSMEARLPAAVEAVLGDLRAEYGRQLRAVAALRRLYDERAAAAAAEAEAREKRLRVEERARRDAVATCLELQEQASRSSEEAAALREEVSQIHAAFARLLEVASAPAIDALARRLHQNRDLLTDIAAEGDGAAALSRTLMELAAQAEAADADVPDHTTDATDADAVPAAGNPSPAMDRTEIVTNLPKVWKVLTELLSQQQAAGEVGEPPSDADREGDPAADDVKSHCYKSVDTPYGPRQVISVSQTFLRLKELILEKKSLQRELSRLQQLNGHLETELGRQQQRLSLVSSELRKTWGVVGRMRAQHRQLHTHETLLRHELQHKREMLRELRDELSSCRETWQRARQKSSQSEVEWRALRSEFAERRRRRDAGSAESGCFSDSGDDTKETPSGGSCSPVAEECSALEAEEEDAGVPSNCPAHSEGAPESCATVSMVKKLKEQLAWFSRSLEPVARDDEDALHSIFSLPAITIPDAVYCRLGWVDSNCDRSCGDGAEECQLEGKPEPDTRSPEDREVQVVLTCPAELVETLKEGGGISCMEECTVSEVSNGTEVETDVEAEERRRRRREGAYRRLAACLEAPAIVLEEDYLLTRNEAATLPELTPVAPLDETALEARAQRLRRLEEQCQQLVRRVTRTAHRSDRLSSRLEELHEQYGSSSSPESSPAAPGSPVARRRGRLPPVPPPLPVDLPRIPAPPHMPAELPALMLPTASDMDSVSGHRPPPPSPQPPATGDTSGGDNTAEG